MDIAALRVRIEGEVIDAADANYESVRTDMWNQLKPDRYPDLIEASSAGLMALGTIASPTTAVLTERKVPASGLASKPL